MTPRILIIISALFAIYLSSCKSPADLTEDVVYTILNEIIADDSLYVNRACWKFQNIDLKTEMKKEFTKEDLDFIEQQQTLFKNTTIISDKLKWYHGRKNAFVSTTIDTVCNEGILYHI